MATPKRENGLDHVVVVMFENRSFDHLLGRLYEPGEVPSLEGVIGKDLSNPIPEWAEHGADRGVVRYGVAGDMNTPYPDPGEEYPHINTQLFGRIEPPSNRGVPTEQMIAPFNAPADPDQVPTMDGFVADYFSAFTAEMGRQPTHDEYSQIMTRASTTRRPHDRHAQRRGEKPTTGTRRRCQPAVVATGDPQPTIALDERGK